MPCKCVSLLSGGLDSMLATLLMVEQGVQVTAVQFMTNFGCDASPHGSCSRDSSSLARQFGFDLKLCHAGEAYIRMVQNPQYGYGKNMNPCIDCRIFMLRSAQDYGEAIGASFYVTGEVVNQRPMSQHRPTLTLIDHEVGLEGRLLRPLSAQLLPPTIPEIEGLVDRAKLFGISGRSRKVQIELAQKFGIEDYAQPSGGCLLTDRGYSQKVRDLFQHSDRPSPEDVNLLRVGRHFRLSESIRLIVGRNEGENKILESYFPRGYALLLPKNAVGPTGLLQGASAPSSEELTLAGLILKRYSDIAPQNPLIIELKSPGVQQSSSPDSSTSRLLDSSTPGLLRPGDSPSPTLTLSSFLPPEEVSRYAIVVSSSGSPIKQE